MVFDEKNILALNKICHFFKNDTVFEKLNVKCYGHGQIILFDI